MNFTCGNCCYYSNVKTAFCGMGVALDSSLTNCAHFSPKYETQIQLENNQVVAANKRFDQMPKWLKRLDCIHYERVVRNLRIPKEKRNITLTIILDKTKLRSFAKKKKFTLYFNDNGVDERFFNSILKQYTEVSYSELPYSKKYIKIEISWHESRKPKRKFSDPRELPKIETLTIDIETLSNFLNSVGVVLRNMSETPITFSPEELNRIADSVVRSDNPCHQIAYDYGLEGYQIRSQPYMIINGEEYRVFMEPG